MDTISSIDQEKTTKSFNDFYKDFKPASLELLDNRGLANKDYHWRIKNRGLFAGTIMGILVAQNLLIYALIYIAFFTRELGHLQLILGILLSGTLAETYFTLNHVVKWLFNDIDYKAMKDF
jgi:hypothetical protein